MRGVTWPTAGGLLTRLGIDVWSILPFAAFREARDAARRRDAPAISENADWPRLRLFVVDRAESCESGALKAPDQAAIGTAFGAESVP